MPRETRTTPFTPQVRNRLTVALINQARWIEIAWRSLIRLRISSRSHPKTSAKTEGHCSPHADNATDDTRKWYGRVSPAIQGHGGGMSAMIRCDPITRHYSVRKTRFHGATGFPFRAHAHDRGRIRQTEQCAHHERRSENALLPWDTSCALCLMKHDLFVSINCRRDSFGKSDCGTSHSVTMKVRARSRGSNLRFRWSPRWVNGSGFRPLLPF